MGARDVGKGLRTNVEICFMSVICSCSAKGRMAYWNYSAVGKNSKDSTLSFVGMGGGGAGGTQKHNPKTHTYASTANDVVQIKRLS